MSSKRRPKYFKTIGFKLTAWYTSVFILSSLILFAAVYFILASTLRSQDREAVETELYELVAFYNQGGVRVLAGNLRLRNKFGGGEPFFIRVADENNRTLYLSLPYQWVEIDLNELDKTTRQDGILWSNLPLGKNGGTMELAGKMLKDGRYLQVGKAARDRERLLSRYRRIVAVILIPPLILGFFGGLFLTRRALQPIRNLIRTIREIQAGRMDARVPDPRTEDEFQELVMLFNHMLGRIETLIEAMKDSLDNVAHDLRSPLTRLRVTAETALLSDQDEQSYREALGNCIEESDRILVMLNTLMDISEAEAGALKPDLQNVDVCRVIEEVLDIYRFVAEEKAIGIHYTEPEERLTIRADDIRLKQAVANLTDNAVKYTPPGGRIDIEVSEQPHGIDIIVRDNGVGIPEDDLPRIWDRLFRGDRSRSEKGLGLGLSLVRAVIQAHGGSVDVVSSVNEGSVFTVHLPSH